MFTNSRPSHQSGFALVEFMTAAGLSGLLVIVCGTLMIYTVRSVASVSGSVDLNARSRYAMDSMSQKLRQASLVKSFSATSLAVTYKGQPLTYTYNTNLKTLVEITGGVTNALVEDCDGLTFKYYKRNALTNAFNQFPALTVTNEAKVIQVSWSCSRNLVGRKSGASEMVSANIVLRTPGLGL